MKATGKGLSHSTSSARHCSPSAPGMTVFETQAQIVAAGYLVFWRWGLLPCALASDASAAENAGWPATADRRLRSAGSIPFLVLYLVVPFALLYALSALRPKFNPRYLMLASPAYVMLIATGISWLSTTRRSAARLAAAAGLAYVIATSAYALANNYSNRVYVRDDVRSVVATITAGRQPGEAVVLGLRPHVPRI